MESFRTVGTCAKQIIFEIKDNKLTNCKFINGCSGGGQGLAKLCLGQEVDYIIEKLQGIQCRSGTSCPDQLTRALTNFKEKQAAKEKQG
ncbi:MAG: TIGR03905 family TSCPD domain-containing protein [Firmicutes bacterium]|nr:TIGR03905 family TSCPD domain-containing protein [Bacillota bacterium]